jgi:alpha-tubulin suppressor-like RCC1 family protein
MHASRALVRCLALSAVAACVPTYAFDGVDGGANDAPAADAPLARDAAVEVGTGDAAPPADSGVDAPIEASAEGGVGVIGEGRVVIGGVYPYLTSCSVRAGIVSCIGDNSGDQLGRGPDAGAPADLRPVVDTDGGSFGGASRVQAGSSFACAQRGDQIFCWGDNGYAELGQGFTSRSSPVPVAVQTSSLALAGVRYFTAGGWQGCAVMTDGGVSCWGANNYDQVCSPDAGSSLSVATPVPDLGGARDVATGAFHTCAAMEPDGHVVCCGRNEQRQAGQAAASTCNGMPCVPRATTVAGVHDARQVALGWSHSCALQGDGSIACWGMNDFGQLGGSTDAGTCPGATDAGVPCSETPPVAVRPPAGSFTQVAVTSVSTCGLVDNGQVWCWGSNEHGALGHSGAPDGPTPVPVETSAGTALASIAGLAGGDSLMCGVSTGGVVYCWGLGVPGDGGNQAFYAVVTPL